MSDLSRVEQLLRNVLGEDIYEVTPQSRVEALLVELNELIEGMDGSVSPEDIETAVAAYLDEHLTNPTNPPVDTSLSISGAAADAKKTGDELSDLKEGLTEITETGTTTVTYDMDSDVFTTQGGYIYTDGSVKSASSTAHGIWYFQAPEDMSVYLTNLASATNKYNLVIYSGTPLTSSRMVTYKGGTELPTESDQLSVESGQYVAISIYNQTYPAKKNFNLVCAMPSGEIALASALGLTATMSGEVKSLIESDGAEVARTVVTNSKENIFVNDGWETLPVDKFARNAWADYNSIDSRASRVRYTEDLVFDRDVTLLAKEGFYLVAFASDAPAFYDANTYIDLPAGRTIHVYVRRINENSSETASVEEFADALLISTPLADMERLAHTFTDISMFERVGIGGDSYAAGGGIISGVRPLTWGKNLERQAGIIVDIYAKSGETIVQWNSDATNGLPALLAGTECGLYWLAHGINGTSTDEAIGAVSDMSESPRPQTFYGQYAEAIEQIKTAFPNARIVIQTICGSSYKLYQANYNKVNIAIRNIAEYCGIPLIDVADDDFYKSRYYSSNIRSNHPTAMVAAGMAHANRRLIAKCILENPDYFINYGT